MSDGIAASQRFRGFSMPSLTFRIAFLFVLLIVAGNLTRVNSYRQCKPRNLRFVIMIHRHGDRTPVFRYKTDPYNNYKWPGGSGALTPKGIQQLCNLGRNIISRYSSLFQCADCYTTKNVRVLSSSQQRCVDSANSLLSCLTPNGNRQKRKIKIITIPKTRDNILLQSMPCPKYEKMLKNMIERPKRGSPVKAFNQQNAHLYAYVSDNIGENIKDSVRLGKIYDTLLVQRDNNLRLPQWVNPIFPNALRVIKDRSGLLYTETLYMKRIRGGKLVTNMVTQMKKKRDGGLVQNIQIYSAHDSTLVNVMNALGVISQTSAGPDYGAALAFELYDTHNGCGDWVVELVYYFNSQNRNPKKISIPGCPYPCTIGQLRTAVDKIWLRQDEYNFVCN